MTIVVPLQPAHAESIARNGASAPAPPSDAVGDRELVERMARADVAAHEALYRRHAASVATFVRRLVSDPEAAEDVVHDVFLDAWHSAPRYRGDAAVRSWLFAIAHHRACNELRRRRTRSPASLARAFFGRGRAAAESADPRRAADERLDVTAAVAELPQAQAVVIALVYWHGLSVEEAARVVGAPIGTVKSRLGRARATLLARLEDLDELLS